MRSVLIIVNLLLCEIVFSQQVNDCNLFQYKRLKEEYTKGSKRHTALKRSYSDSLVGYSLLFRNSKETQFTIRPLVDLSIVSQESNSRHPKGFGAGAEGRFKHKKWNAGISYLLNHQQYLDYQNRYIEKNKVVPGMGVSSGFTNDYIRNSYTSGFLNYRANKYFSFEAGYGRNFIGDGYRSLLLADATSAYPYLKIQTKFWNIQYTNIFSSHRNIFQVEGRKELYQKKYNATHYLDWRATKWLSVGLFETIIWGAEEGNYTRGFDVNYANPFIFYRPVEFSVGSSDNALVGANLKLTISKNHVLYSQLLFDEFLLAELRADFDQWRNPNDSIRSGWWANKYGIQLGWTAFDLFKIEGFQTRAEFNLVRPYTYAHSNSTQAYSHDNLSLAHPLGANFYEFVSRANYEVDRWNFALNYHQNNQGRSNFGQNFGESLQLSNTSRELEYENALAQGQKVVVKYLEASVSYLICKKANTTLSLSHIAREENIENSSSSTNFFMLRLHSNLFNKYFDY
ncbi:hypothetical protein N9502_00870 [Vicingaceae bacterium]|nr:hypothetical protein [Vicingaceae bacterium]